MFFNTFGQGGQFIYASNSRGRVRMEKLTSKYWAQRFELVRTEHLEIPLRVWQDMGHLEFDVNFL